MVPHGAKKEIEPPMNADERGSTRIRILNCVIFLSAFIRVHPRLAL